MLTTLHFSIYPQATIHFLNVAIDQYAFLKFYINIIIHFVLFGGGILDFFPHLVYIWRRKWQPTPVFLPGKSHGWRSLVGCSPWGR